MRSSRKWWPAILLGMLAVGCGSSSGAGADVSSSMPDYGTTKQMVVDILHSSEGQTAVADVLRNPKMKQQVIVSETDISQAVEKTLQSSKNQSFLSQQAKDPKFADALAKAVKPDLIQTERQLMKEPEYQKDMLVLLKSPEFTKNLQDLFQTPEFRGVVMKIMTDALKTPSFRMQFQDALKQAVSESMQQAGGSSGGGQGGGGQSSGGGGGSGGQGGQSGG